MAAILAVVLMMVAAACGTDTATDAGADTTINPADDDNGMAMEDPTLAEDPADDDNGMAMEDPTLAEDPADDQTGDDGATGQQGGELADGEMGLRTYDVDGATVYAWSALAELPPRASVVEFTTTLIDSGNGLELCLGGVAESLPPQCGGPVVDGLDPEGWTETQSGVTWGERTVVVEWPPAESDNDQIPGRLTLISDRDASWPEPVDEPDFSSPPDECADMTSSVDSDVLGRFAEANPDRTGTLWVVDNGRITVLPVLEEHMDDVRSELEAQIGADAQLCLTTTAFSSAELRAAQELLHNEAPPESPTWVLGSGSGNRNNTLDVQVAVADRETVDAIVGLYDDPSLLRIYSTGAILEAS